MHTISFTSLLLVAAVAFLAPLILGLLPIRYWRRDPQTDRCG